MQRCDSGLDSAYDREMMPPEEVLRNIEYVRCPSCHGSRVFPSVLPGFRAQECTRCRGWGCVADPSSPEERIALGLKAIFSTASLDITRPKRKKRLKLPLRKKRK